MELTSTALPLRAGRFHHLMTSEAGPLLQPVEGNKHSQNHGKVTCLPWLHAYSKGAD